MFEKAIHPIAENTAPGSALWNLDWRLLKKKYINWKTNVITANEKTPFIKTISVIEKCIYLRIRSLIRFPKTWRTRVAKIKAININVYNTDIRASAMRLELRFVLYILLTPLSNAAMPREADHNAVKAERDTNETDLSNISLASVTTVGLIAAGHIVLIQSIIFWLEMGIIKPINDIRSITNGKTDIII